MHDEEMGKQALTFKHLILQLEDKESKEGGYTVTVADLASLMESLQSALLKYWQYNPTSSTGKDDSDETSTSSNKSPDGTAKPTKRSIDKITDATATLSGDSSSGPPTFKKKPIVFLLDEAHKLPALINDTLSLKVFLDTLLVLTKQDRLCHVLFATSDPFFQHFLRSMNVGHHTSLLTIGDCSREETLAYFLERCVPSVPRHLAGDLGVQFEEIWETFGGKLSHVNDFVSSWAESEGSLTPLKSAIFVQAYTLLQFHLTRRNFETFSPLSTATASSRSDTNADEDAARFSRDDLLYVMRVLTAEPFSIPYFTLCRRLGTSQVDSMIQARILEVRWTRSVSPEEGWVERRWSEDGIERPVVLPMTRVVRKAMEVVLREEDEIVEAEREERGAKEAREEKEKEKDQRDWKEEKKREERHGHR